MTREEFLASVDDLVGPERGKLRRFADLLGVSPGMIYLISQNERPVPEAYARRLREVRQQAVKGGDLVPWIAPRMERAVQAAVAAGWTRDEAIVAILAWGALARLRAA